MRTLRIIAPIIFSLLLLLPSLTPANALVKLMNEAEVKGGEITLGEIAHIEADTKAEAERLKAVTLISAPRPGESYRISRAHVETMLEREGIDLRSVKIEGGSVLVKRSYQRVKAERLMKALEEFLKRETGSPARVSIIPTTPVRDLLVPEGKVSIFVRSISDDPLWGWFRIKVMVDGKTAEETSIFARVRVERDVVVAVKPIRAGQRISADMVKVERMMIGLEGKDAFEKVRDVLGKIPSRSIGKGEFIKRSDLRLPVIVRRGDVVMIVARYGMIRITARGKAVENGKLGDVIEVENLSSKRHIRAEVISPGVVMVRLGGEGNVERKTLER
ncbi:flagellar basal body P-ring formation protein FlgA [Candidatus Poribacteria bacterium]|nr:flagellar basal body P-ring formation protein FlgA [Candidatus Poribacteria bacterium]